MSQHKGPWTASEDWGARVEGPAIGPRRLTAYALALLGLDVVNRHTVRAMLPKGVVIPSTPARRRAGGGSKNRTSIEFGNGLRLFEDSGWIQRGETYVLILNRRALLDYALDRFEGVPGRLLEIEGAVDVVLRRLTEDRLTPKAVEQANRELAALRRLMAPTVRGASYSGRGSVRRVGPAGSGE